MNKLTEVEKLQNRVKTIYRKIEKIQTECKHRKCEKTSRGNTGNYSKSDDRYWNDCYCPYCQKRWTEELPNRSI